MNNDIKTSVVLTTADVSVSETNSEISTRSQIATITTAETETTIKPTASQKSKGSATYPKSQGKVDTGKNS